MQNLKLNTKVFQKVKKHHKRLLVVTKYFTQKELAVVAEKLWEHEVVWAVGENRLEGLFDKNWPREKCHFIGRLQSRKLAKIVDLVSVIHSLESLDHARKLNEISQAKDLSIEVFVQVNVAGDLAKGGIAPAGLEAFLLGVESLTRVKVIGLSSMGWGEFTVKQKKAEFQALLDLRDQLLPGGLTSAGTSRDYELALEAGIDRVRVGEGCFERVAET